MAQSKSTEWLAASCFWIFCKENIWSHEQKTYLQHWSSQQCTGHCLHWSLLYFMHPEYGPHHTSQTSQLLGPAHSASSCRFEKIYPKEKELMISVFLDPETIKSIPDNVNEAIFRMKAWLQQTLIYRLLALLGEVIFEESQLCVLDLLTDLKIPFKKGCRMGMKSS